jgi:hypothetical protein
LPPLPLVSLEFEPQLVIRGLRRPPEALDRGAEAVGHALDGPEHVGRHVIGPAVLLAIGQVGGRGEVPMYAIKEVNDDEELIGRLPEGGLRLGDRPRVGRRRIIPGASTRPQYTGDKGRGGASRRYIL